METYRKKISPVPANNAAPLAAPAAPTRPTVHAPQMKRKVYQRSAMAALMPQATLAPALPSALEEFESYIAETSLPGTDVLEFWAVGRLSFTQVRF